MAGFNRFFIVLMALVWCAAIGLAVSLVWDQGRFLEVNRGGIEFMLNVTLDRAERILATIVLVGLALPALGLIAMELRRSAPAYREDRGATSRIEQLQGRVESLERRLSYQAPTAQSADNTPPESREATVREPATRRWHFPLASRR
jgi:hypothetical protein